MQSVIRARFVLLVLTCWALANLLVYFVLEWQSASALGKRQPSRMSLKLFESPPNQLESADSLKRMVLPYRLMSPANLRSGTRYPLVVFLHGAGEKGNDNQAQLLGLPEQMAESRWRTRFPCFLFAPQCPVQSDWTLHSDDLIDHIRQIMKDQPIDATRVYLTGLSMGGYGCWSLAAKEPELFSAVVPICGGGERNAASRLVTVPIWAVHGSADEAVPVQRSREMIAAIREAGGRPNYTELNGVGHDSWTQTYQDPNGVLKWMFKQRRTSVARLSSE